MPTAEIENVPCTCEICTRARERQTRQWLEINGGTPVGEENLDSIWRPCENCGTEPAALQQNRFGVTAWLCDICSSAQRQQDSSNRSCESCRARRGYYRETSGTLLCRPCYNSSYWTCSNCDTTYNYDEQDYCDCESPDDIVSDDDNALIKYYSYKPQPIFHGEGPLFLGAEIEISTPFNNDHYSYSVRERNQQKRLEAAKIAQDHLSDLGYLKEDGSIRNGFEMVTHPMTYPWAMENFPWPMLSELKTFGCEPHESCGMHIHVSRKGFSSPTHIYQWMKFFYRNQRPIQTIARRRDNSYSRFDGNERENIKYYAKNQRPRNHGMMRYAAINATNRETFELRVFASSLNETEVQAAMGLAHASIEYTRKLTSADVLKNKGWEWPTFSRWVKANEIYQPLTEEMEKRNLCAY